MPPTTTKKQRAPQVIGSPLVKTDLSSVAQQRLEEKKQEKVKKEEPAIKSVSYTFLESLPIEQFATQLTVHCCCLKDNVEKLKKALGEETCSKIAWASNFMMTIMGNEGCDMAPGSSIYVVVGRVKSTQYHEAQLLFDPLSNAFSLYGHRGTGEYFTNDTETDIKSLIETINKYDWSAY